MIAELEARVRRCEKELDDCRTFGETQQVRFACQTALDAATNALAIAHLKLELDKAKADWEERWSRRWEP